MLTIVFLVWNGHTEKKTIHHILWPGRSSLTNAVQREKVVR